MVAGQDCSGLDEGLQVGQHGSPAAGGRFTIARVREVLVSDGQTNDLTVGLDLEGDARLAVCAVFGAA